MNACSLQTTRVPKWGLRWQIGILLLDVGVCQLAMFSLGLTMAEDALKKARSSSKAVRMF